ncbi:alpha-hydroxy acid oxidase [Achromobacter xylosoxidans]|uniref:alpha-hydroxy acid oxidase n=1 Tax=Alcaligenes xylosoxydans xylosoxydans TaxID=85698 RepID=UPI001F133BEA|nr:alpha-hydroxy acid oxidase [Achromobacter xylosoxidans]
MVSLDKVLSLADFEVLARKRLPHPLFGYIAGDSEDGHSQLENRLSFRDYSFKPRVLIDISDRHQSIQLFGREYASPVGIAPMGIAALTAYRGDMVLARAAHRAQIPAIMSGWSLIPLEVLARAAPRTWFQAYLPRKLEQSSALIDRVEAAGFDTLVITVDTPSPANRENNVRTGFSSPLRPSARLAWQGISHPRWLFSVFLRTLWHHGLPHFENWHGERGTPMFSSSLDADIAQRGHLTWGHIRNIRDRWGGNLVLKGILAAADAKLAREHGADGIIVSNHGGRQLDGAVAPLRVLPEIIENFGAGPVMIDGGIRRGTDVVKALALGAACVFVGRPFNYAAAVGGEPGVAHAIGLLQQEVSRNMAMLGVRSLLDLSADYLYRSR